MFHDRQPVICCGEILIDLIVSDGSTTLLDARSFEIHAGGAPANVAVGLARLGVPTRFCGVVGDDPLGARLRSTLHREGVDTSALRTVPEVATTIAFAWKDEVGDGHFRLYRHADQLLDADDVHAAGIEHATALVAGSVALSGRPSAESVQLAVETAVQAGVPIVFDVNIRPSLWSDRESIRAICLPVMEAARIVKLSLDDARHLGFNWQDPGSVIAEVAVSDGQFVVVTDGARGAWAGMRRHDELRLLPHVPAFDVEAVDPTGAGDAFTAALICRFRDREWLSMDRDDIRYAAAAGALATTRPGAMTSLPDQIVIDAFLASQSGVS
ncbi:MAG: carbohydrate kinase [Thermomicrobiales bacterium]